MVQKYNVIGVTRILSELSRGAPVTLCDGNHRYSFLSLDNTPRNTGKCRISLSDERLAWLGMNRDISIMLSDASPEELKALAFSTKITHDLLNRCTFVARSECERLILRLLRLARVSSSAITLESTHPDALEFSVTDITNFLASKPDIYISHRINLVLRDSYPVEAIMFKERYSCKLHLAILSQEVTDTPLVRVHSACLFGDVMGSEMCDCGGQLNKSLALMRRDNFVLLYMDQEGRDIGLENKIRTYELQKEGHDTMNANKIVGFAADERSFFAAAKMLQLLGITSCNLLTSNPLKAKALEEEGIKIKNQIRTGTFLSKHNKRYLQTKHDNGMFEYG